MTCPLDPASSVEIADGVQSDEDWQLSIAYYLDDGVTPIGLDGLEFTLSVGAFATLNTGDGHIVVSGPSNNLIVITVLAAEKAGWPAGVYPISLSVDDGFLTRDLFASSTLTVGAAQITHVSLLVAPDIMATSIAAQVPAALAAALQALQPARWRRLWRRCRAPTVCLDAGHLRSRCPCKRVRLRPSPAASLSSTAQDIVVIAQ